MYSFKQFQSIGTKYLVNFGKYSHFSQSVVGGSSSNAESISFSQSSFDEVFDAKPDFLINTKAASPTNGTEVVKVIIVLGLNPMSHSAA